MSHGFTIVMCDAALAADCPTTTEQTVGDVGNIWLSAAAFASACQAAKLALAGLQECGSWRVPLRLTHCCQAQFWLTKAWLVRVCWLISRLLQHCLASSQPWQRELCKVYASESHSTPDCASEAAESFLPKA